MQKKYLIIGAAAAGISAANTLSRLDAQAAITVLSNETESPYNKCFLADYLANQKSDQQLEIFSGSAARTKNIDLVLGVQVNELLCDTKQVSCANGAIYAYDALLIATGSRPSLPSIAGIDAYPGVFTFHTMRDMYRIQLFCRIQEVSRVVIIGAGLSGIECADSLTQLGMQCTIIERQNRVLSAFADSVSGAFVGDHLVRHGVNLFLNQVVTQVLGSGHGVAGVVLADGTTISADMIICATGLISNGELAGSAGLRLHEKSISVDEYMRTSDPYVYAAGDVVVVKDAQTGELVRSATWPDAMHQGMIAAHVMAGSPKPYPGITQIASSSFFGIKFFSNGLRFPSDNRLVEKRLADTLEQYVFDPAGRVNYFLLVGPHVQVATVRRLLMTRQSNGELLL